MCSQTVGSRLACPFPTEHLFQIGYGLSFGSGCWCGARTATALRVYSQACCLPDLCNWMLTSARCDSWQRACLFCMEFSHQVLAQTPHDHRQSCTKTASVVQVRVGHVKNQVLCMKAAQGKMRYPLSGSNLARVIISLPVRSATGA